MNCYHLAFHESFQWATISCWKFSKVMVIVGKMTFLEFVHRFFDLYSAHLSLTLITLAKMVYLSQPDNLNCLYDDNWNDDYTYFVQYHVVYVQIWLLGICFHKYLMVLILICMNPVILNYWPAYILANSIY